MRLDQIVFGNPRLAALKQSCEARRQNLMQQQSVKTQVFGGSLATIALVTASILLMSGPATAAMLNLTNGGMFNGGNFSVQVNAGANACINFFNGNTPDTCPPNSSNTWTLGGPSDPMFGTPGVTVGTTQDFLFANQPSMVPGTIAPYLNGIQFLTITFAGVTYTFDIQAIPVPNLGACPPGGGVGSCSASDFAFTQQNLSGTNCPAGFSPCGDVDVAFAARGIGYTGTSATGSTPYSFNFSSHFVNETTSHLIFLASNGGVTDSVSFNAAPSAAVPEPGGLILVGAGLLGISILSRRLPRRQN
jgi:hypothetical protein